MSDSQFPSDEVPDFVPPELADSINSAPKENPVNPQPASRPDQFDKAGQFGQPRRPAWQQPAEPRPSKPKRNRWFNQPSYGGNQSLFASLGLDAAPVTSWLIIVLVVVWIAQLLLPGFSSLITFYPALALHSPWALVTSIFAHSTSGITHLIFNLLSLWILGRYLEPAFGSKNFLWLYLVSGIGGNVVYFSLAMSPTNPLAFLGVSWFSGVLGASGAIFGLLGAYFAGLRLTRQNPETEKALLFLLCFQLAAIFFDAALNLSIAWQAHIGGFLVGALLVFADYKAIKRRWVKPNKAAIVYFVILVILLLAFVGKILISFV